MCDYSATVTNGQVFQHDPNKAGHGQKNYAKHLTRLKKRETSYLQVVQMDCAWNSVKQLLCAISLLLPEDHYKPERE